MLKSSWHARGTGRIAPIPARSEGASVGRVVGIDLGTTYSLVATVQNSRPRIIADQGERLIPSVVGFSANGELLVGTPAATSTPSSQRTRSGRSSARWVKPRRSRCAAEVPASGDLGADPAEAQAGGGARPGRACQSGGHHVYGVLHGRRSSGHPGPGEIAGLEVVRIINEPTASSAGVRARSRRGPDEWPSTTWAAARSTSRSSS